MRNLLGCTTLSDANIPHDAPSEISRLRFLHAYQHNVSVRSARNDKTWEVFAPSLVAWEVLNPSFVISFEPRWHNDTKGTRCTSLSAVSPWFKFIPGNSNRMYH